MKQPLCTILWQCFVPCFVQTLRIVLGVATLAVFSGGALWLIVGTLYYATRLPTMDHNYIILICSCVIVTTVVTVRWAWRVYFGARTTVTTVSAAEEREASTTATPGDPRASLYRPLINPNVNDKTMWL